MLFLDSSYSNIFELAKKYDCKVLKVKRHTWEYSFAFIKKVKFQVSKNGLYGKAYGEIYYSNGNVVSGEISCAGCCQWKVLEVLDEDMLVME